MADSVDIVFGDCLVYGPSCMRYPAATAWKAGAALAKGLFILVFGIARICGYLAR
jgi:hypothetical protein